MANTYDVGDIVRVTGPFRDSATPPVAYDPTVVKCVIRTPAGVETTYTHGVDGVLVKDSVGNYHVDVDATASGIWYYRWYGTGVGQVSDEGYFSVVPSQFAPVSTAYASVPQLREYLGNVANDDTTTMIMRTILERATDIIDGELGFSFADWDEYAVGTERDVWSGSGGRYLYLPAHAAGSVESAMILSGRGETDETETAVTDYVAELRWRLFRNSGWIPRTWYRVKAQWGYGPVPDSIVEVTLEVAVNIWKGRDATQWTGTLGAEGGGGTPYRRALSWAQRAIIDTVRGQHPAESIA